MPLAAAFEPPVKSKNTGERSPSPVLPGGVMVGRRWNGQF